ncbi:uncharacterized protein [Oscarella lobularis]|uniref:uncharacterized protein isoform X2 n=1 Tax=Oscarella lobularis TaxID=121494 RepID=UPI003314118D
MMCIIRFPVFVFVQGATHSALLSTERTLMNSVQATAQGVSRSEIDLLFHCSVLTADDYDRIVISPPVQRSKLLQKALRRNGDAVKRIRELKSSNKAQKIALHYLTTPHNENVDFPQLRRAALCSLKRAWGLGEKDFSFLTRLSSQPFTTCCLVIRDNSVIEVSCGSPNMPLNNFKKALAYASSTSLRKICEKEIKFDNAKDTFRVPSQVAMAILLAFSSFANQMQFGAKFRHFYNNQDVLTFSLGSFPPISMKLPSGCISPAEDSNATLSFEQSRLKAIVRATKQRVQASSRQRAKLFYANYAIDESENILKACAEKVETCSSADFQIKPSQLHATLKEPLAKDTLAWKRMQCRKTLDDKYRTLLAALNRSAEPPQPLEDEIAMPTDLLPHVLGKRHRILNEIERKAAGTRIKYINNRIHIMSRTERSAKQAVREICYKASVAHHFNSTFENVSRVHHCLTLVPRSKTTTYTLKLQKEMEASSCTHRLKCNKQSAEINFARLDEMKEKARNFLVMCQEGRFYKSTLDELHTWFHLGRVKHEVNDPRRDQIPVYSPRDLERQKNDRFFPGLYLKDFDFSRLESFLEGRPGCQHSYSYVRHDITIIPPSFASRRFIVRIPPVDDDEEEAYMKAAGYPITNFCKGQHPHRVGPGYLCEKLYADFHLDVLMPDLPSDCRLLIRTATLDLSEERRREDQILVEEFCKKVLILGTFLYLPKLPRGYRKDFHRKSTTSVFNYREDHEIIVTQEEELESGQTIEREPSKEGKRVDIHVKDTKLHKLLRPSKMGNWNLGEVLQRMKDCVEVTRMLVKMIKEWL